MVTFSTLMQFEKLDTLNCSCGEGSAFICSGKELYISQDIAQTDAGFALCRLCREYETCGTGTGQNAEALTQLCLHCQNCGIGISLHSLHFVPCAPLVCEGCAQWMMRRWPFADMWTHTTRRTFVVDMVREVVKVHAFEAVTLRICGRIASCILTQWNSYIPSEKCLLFTWGWIWSITLSILQVLDIPLRHSSNPAWCMGPDDHVPLYAATTQDVRRWRTHCDPELVLPPTVDVPLSEQARRWQELWVREETHTVKNRLELSFWKPVGEADSDVSSVEGGEIEDCHSKICRYQACPYDVREDVDNEMNTGIRHLYLCSACNKGFHLDCV
jgi:hypothetical protein